MKKISIFISAVSDEFHHSNDEKGNPVNPRFRSYRTEIKETLESMIKLHDTKLQVDIFTQEDSLNGESGDMLDILERNVRKSDYVIHLLGFLPGESPKLASLNLFKERNPTFFILTA